MEPGNEVTSGFVIDGQEYPIPALDTFDIDESILLYEYSGLTLEDFAPASDDEDEDEVAEQRAQKVKHPGFLKALLHVAYSRGNPTAKPARVQAVVGAANLIEVVEQLIAEEGDEESPPAPALTIEPTLSSPKSSDDSTESSGTDSLIDSDPQDEVQLDPIGITR